jgi:hypothetical protein
MIFNVIFFLERIPPHRKTPLFIDKSMNCRQQSSSREHRVHPRFISVAVFSLRIFLFVPKLIQQTMKMDTDAMIKAGREKVF